VIFEDENSENRGETTCLGKQTNEHQKAFNDLLGAHTCIRSESYTDFIAWYHFRGSCDERAKGLAEQHVKSALASLNTLNTVLYKKFLQDTIGGWYSLFPEVRAAPRAGRASLAGDEGGDVEEPEEGEEGFIGGEVPVL